MEGKASDSPVLFIPNGTIEDVILNWHGSPREELYFVAEAYQCAASLLAKGYGSSGAIRDFEAYPIVFLFRHAVEAMTKSVLLRGNDLLRLRGRPTAPISQILNDHRLVPLTTHIENLILELDLDWESGKPWLKSKADFMTVTREIDAIDPSAQTFRYTITKKGVPSLETKSLKDKGKNFAFDLKLFCNRMTDVVEFLDCLLCDVEHRYEQEQEAATDRYEYDLEQRAEIDEAYRIAYGDD